MARNKAGKTPSWSRYWIRDEFWGKQNESSSEKAIRLASIRRGVAGFVKILTGRDIPVQFSSGQQSYTDLENVVVISADNKPEHYDSTVGLALHEGSHIVHTKVLDRHRKRLLAKQTEPQKDLTTLLSNVLEDRRIDFNTYRDAPGYQPYYDAMYDRFFYSDAIDAALQRPEFRTPTKENYELHIINAMNPKADPDALPGLREIRDIMDIDNIDRYNKDPNMHKYDPSQTPKMLEDTERIMKIIQQHMIESPPQPQDGEGEEGDGDGEGEEDSDDSGLENWDIPKGGKLSDKDMKRLKKAIKRQKNFVNGKVAKKGVDELEDEDIQNTLQHLEETDADLREVGEADFKDKCKVIVFKKLTDSMVNGSTHLPSISEGRVYHESQNAVAAGRRLGAAMVNRLRVMQDESFIKYTRRPTGALDKRLLAGLGSGAENVFCRSELVYTTPVMVDLSIDASGSMAGPKWEKALTFAAALAYVSTRIRNFRLRVNARTTQDDFAHVVVMFDSAVDTFNHVTRLWPNTGPCGGTPEGLCYEAIRKELLENIKNTRRFFINLSDGEPAFRVGRQSYSGVSAAKHTQRQIEDIRKAGVMILSYFITEYGGVPNKQSLFHTMYGADAAYVNPTAIPDITRTLNKMFMAGLNM